MKGNLIRNISSTVTAAVKRVIACEQALVWVLCARCERRVAKPQDERQSRESVGQGGRGWAKREPAPITVNFSSHPGSYKISQDVRNLTATCGDRWIAEVNIVINNMGRELKAISEVLTKFQVVSGVSFKLKKEQESAVKSLLLNRDVLAVLPTGYGKSLVFQCYVCGKC